MNAVNDEGLLALAKSLGERLEARGEKVATAESCTGGWVSKTLTDVSGSAAWFGYGLVTYANEAKQSLLDVSKQLIEEHGAVSQPVVEAMARGVLRLSGADHAIAISGVAGPDSSEQKPPGMVWFAWASRGTTRGTGPQPSQLDPDEFAVRVELKRFPGGREAVRRASVHHALMGLLARI